MDMKRVIRTALSLVLIAVLAVSMFACSSKKALKGDESIFENQIVNDRYYFQQGYPDDWTYTQGENSTPIRELDMVYGGHEGVLCTKVYPKNNDDMVYTIYKYKNNSTTGVISGYMQSLMADSGASNYPFNDIFFEETARDTYVLTSETPDNVFYSQIQWGKADYTFVKDGEDWKGSFFVTIPPEPYWFIVVVCEAKASAWDGAQETFNQMLEDLYFPGFATNKENK